MWKVFFKGKSVTFILGGEKVFKAPYLHLIADFFFPL